LKRKEYLGTSKVYGTESFINDALPSEWIMKRFPTGIETLDELIDGGFPRPSAISILGEVGVGKSLLCRQIMWNALRQGVNVLFYLTEEPVDEMKEDLLRYGWDIDIFQKEARLKVVDVFSKGVRFAEEPVIEPEELVKKSLNFFEILKEGRDYYFKAIGGGDLLVFFDSLSTVFLGMETRKALAFVQNLKWATRVARCVGIATLETKVHDDKVENTIKSYSDGIIEMKVIEKDGKIIHYMNIPKMSRSDYYQGLCSYNIGKDGFTFSRQVFE